MMYYSFLTFSLLYLSSTFFSFFFFFNDTATTEIYTLSLHDALPISRRLRALTLWLLGRFGGAFRPMRRLPLAPLRRELRSEEHTSELQSQSNLVCRLLLEKKKKKNEQATRRYADNTESDNYHTALHD